MPLTLERVSELLELDVSQLNYEEKCHLLDLSQRLANEKGEQYLEQLSPQEKNLLKASWEYIRSL